MAAVTAPSAKPVTSTTNPQGIAYYTNPVTGYYDISKPVVPTSTGTGWTRVGGTDISPIWSGGTGRPPPTGTVAKPGSSALPSVSTQQNIPTVSVSPGFMAKAIEAGEAAKAGAVPMPSQNVILTSQKGTSLTTGQIIERPPSGEWPAGTSVEQTTYGMLISKAAAPAALPTYHSIFTGKPVELQPTPKWMGYFLKEPYATQLSLFAQSLGIKEAWKYQSPTTPESQRAILSGAWWGAMAGMTLAGTRFINPKITTEPITIGRVSKTFPTAEDISTSVGSVEAKGLETGRKITAVFRAENIRTSIIDTVSKGRFAIGKFTEEGSKFVIEREAKFAGRARDIGTEGRFVYKAVSEFISRPRETILSVGKGVRESVTGLSGRIYTKSTTAFQAFERLKPADIIKGLEAGLDVTMKSIAEYKPSGIYKASDILKPSPTPPAIKPAEVLGGKGTMQTEVEKMAGPTITKPPAPVTEGITAALQKSWIESSQKLATQRITIESNLGLIPNQMQKQVPEGLQKQKPRLDTFLGTESVIIPKQKQGVIPPPETKSFTESLQITEIKTKVGTETKIIQPSLITPFIESTVIGWPPGIVFGMPGFMFPGGVKRPWEHKRRKYRYTPSLTAQYLGLTGKKPPRITGLEIRPMLKSPLKSKMFRMKKLSESEVW